MMNCLALAIRSSVRRSVVVATLTLGALTTQIAFVPAIAAAQTRGPVQRTVRGKVEDKSGAGIKGAVVYLKDGKSQSVKTSIADDDGSYRFVQLAQNTDYEIWAQDNDKKSPTKSISSFDSKNDFTIILKIDR